MNSIVDFDQNWWEPIKKKSYIANKCFILYMVSFLHTSKRIPWQNAAEYLVHSDSWLPCFIQAACDFTKKNLVWFYWLNLWECKCSGHVLYLILAVARAYINTVSRLW